MAGDLLAAARDRGARYLPGTTARALLAGQDSITGVRTDAGTVSAGVVVLATGAWSVARLASALGTLNAMIEQRRRGEPLDPSFDAFMAEFGDLFPGASTLDELLEQLAMRMAGASALLASMDADQRAQLEQLSQELLSDLDLAWQLDQLAEQLRDALPGLGWDQLGLSVDDLAQLDGHPGLVDPAPEG